MIDTGTSKKTWRDEELRSRVPFVSILCKTNQVEKIIRNSI